MVNLSHPQSKVHKPKSKFMGLSLSNPVWFWVLPCHKQGESLSVLTKAGTESFVSEGVDRFCRHKNCQMSFTQLCTTYILCYTNFIEQILVVCSYKNPPQSELVWQATPHSIIPDLGPSAAAMVTSSVLLEEKRFQTLRGKFIFR